MLILLPVAIISLLDAIVTHDIKYRQKKKYNVSYWILLNNMLIKRYTRYLQNSWGYTANCYTAAPERSYIKGMNL